MSEPTCAQCSATIYEGIYDGHTERYFCDFRCFIDWCDFDNYETVLEYYRRMNMYES